MSAIRSMDTQPEVYLRKLLFGRGFRYRKNDRSVFGTPDIWLPKYRTAVFVHGCFWHRHDGCRMAYTPGTRVEFWQKKFDANVRRDALVRQTLEQQDIIVKAAIVIAEANKKAAAEAAKKEATAAAEEKAEPPAANVSDVDAPEDLPEDPEIEAEVAKIRAKMYARKKARMSLTSPSTEPFDENKKDPPR